MLILTRRKNESVLIGNNVTVRVLDVINGQVRIGIEAPQDTKILRRELLDTDKQAQP